MRLRSLPILDCGAPRTHQRGTAGLNDLIGDPFPLNSRTLKWHWWRWHWIHSDLKSVHCPPSSSKSLCAITSMSMCGVPTPMTLPARTPEFHASTDSVIGREGCLLSSSPRLSDSCSARCNHFIWLAVVLQLHVGNNAANMT